MYSDVIISKLKSNNIAKCKQLRNNELTAKQHNFMAFDKDELIGTFQSSCMLMRRIVSISWDFQARGFYEKQGYVVWEELNDCPPGTTVFHLKKEL